VIYSHPRTWLVGTGQAQRRRVEALGMQFDYNAKKAAYIRQHGCCAKCGKYLNMISEDRKGYEGSWTAHDLMPLDEGGSNKAYNCVILCITKPDCHLNFAHGGDPGKRILLTQFAFPKWIFKNSTEQG
jgi:5-methylcytosine-specific restriction endonuclease McrA